MSKYQIFEEYLSNCTDDILHLTFSQIERILGFKLPASNYQYAPAWANNISHQLPAVWMKAGFRAENLNLTQQTITLKRISLPETSTDTQKRPRTRTSVPTLPIDAALSFIKEYHNQTFSTSHSRYLSWYYCYKAFDENRNKMDPATIDYLALHLGMYLASFGMYRGSAFLLQHNYTVHIKAIQVLQDHTYDPLFHISAEDLCKEENLSLLEQLGNAIKECYITQLAESSDRKIIVSDVLLTKILLGTLGCVPAYDRFLQKTLSDYHIASSTYSKNSIFAVAKYYCEHKKAFEMLCNQININGTPYPPMKLLDMCFWQASVHLTDM